MVRRMLEDELRSNQPYRRLHGLIAPVRKAVSADDELLDLFLDFGVREVALGAARAARETRTRTVFPRQFERRAGARRPKIKWFWKWEQEVELRTYRLKESLKNKVRDSVGEIVEQALREEPTPSIGEVARRIRTQVHGIGPEGMAIFSSERAEIIARTEMAMAENAGIVAGYEAAGVEEIEWMAIPGDHGERAHDRLDGVRIRVGETFLTPLGNRLRWPADFDAPIADTINCRCTIRAVAPRG